MIAVNIPLQITIWVYSFLRNRNLQIESNKKIQNMLVTDGLPQGDVMSPSLFNIYTKDIHTIINDTQENIIIQYADDFVILSSGKNENELKNNLQKSLNSFTQEIEKLNQVIKINKTKFMIFGNNTHNIQLNIKNIHIENTNTYKYLGTIIDKKLNFAKHIEHIRNKARTRLNFLKIISAKQINLGPENSLKIYRATIRNILETGAPYISNSRKNSIKTINTLINQAIRKATGCTKTTPLNTLHAIASEIPFHIRSHFIVRKELAKDIVFSRPIRQQLNKQHRTQYKKKKKHFKNKHTIPK